MHYGGENNKLNKDIKQIDMKSEKCAIFNGTQETQTSALYYNMLDQLKVLNDYP